MLLPGKFEILIKNYFIFIQAVSTAAAFGDRICIQSNGKYNLPISSQYIASCDTKNYGCNGGYMDLVHEFLKSGVITGGDFDSDVVSNLVINFNGGVLNTLTYFEK